MPQVIDMTPKFADEEPSDKGFKEVKEAPVEETEEEKETPEEPSTLEKPAEEEIAEETIEPSEDDAKREELAQAVQGLATEREQLLAEIQELRGQRRQIRQEELAKVEERIDELKDVNPDDIAIIEKILKSRGYISRDDFNKTLYDQTQQEVLTGFLDKYPEFKPENDPRDTNWNALQRALKDYNAPRSLPLAEFKSHLARILEKARKDVPQIGERGDTTAQRKQVKTASMGGGGVAQRPSSSGYLTPQQREAYSRGGYTEEEITELEQKLASK